MTAPPNAIIGMYPGPACDFWSLLVLKARTGVDFWTSLASPVTLTKGYKHSFVTTFVLP